MPVIGKKNAMLIKSADDLRAFTDIAKQEHGDRAKILATKRGELYVSKTSGRSLTWSRVTGARFHQKIRANKAVSYAFMQSFPEAVAEQDQAKIIGKTRNDIKQVFAGNVQNHVTLKADEISIQLIGFDAAMATSSAPAPAPKPLTGPKTARQAFANVSADSRALPTTFRPKVVVIQTRTDSQSEADRSDDSSQTLDEQLDASRAAIPALLDDVDASITQPEPNQSRPGGDFAPVDLFPKNFVPMTDDEINAALADLEEESPPETLSPSETAGQTDDKAPAPRSPRAPEKTLGATPATLIWASSPRPGGLRRELTLGTWKVNTLLENSPSFDAKLEDAANKVGSRGKFCTEANAQALAESLLADKAPNGKPTPQALAYAYGEGADSFKAALASKIEASLQRHMKKSPGDLENFCQQVFDHFSLGLLSSGLHVSGQPQMVDLKQGGQVELLSIQAPNGDIFKPVKHVGTGGYAHVFKYADENGNSFAVKVPVEIEGQTNDPQDAIKEVRNHARASGFGKGAQNENVVEFIGVVQVSPDTFYTCMALAENGDVYSLCDDIDTLLSLNLVDGKTADVLRLTALGDFAEGMSQVARSGVLHNDVKSPNVFVNKNGHAQVADFGESRRARKASLASVAKINNPHWDSPESQVGKGIVSDEQSAFRTVTGQIKIQRDKVRKQFAEEAKLLNQSLNHITNVHQDNKQKRFEEKVITEKSDVWGYFVSVADSFGVSAKFTKFASDEAEMTSAFYQDRNANAVVRDTTSRDPNELKKFGGVVTSTGDEDLDAFLNWGLQPRPEDRPTFSDVASHPIFRRKDVRSDTAHTLIAEIKQLTPHLQRYREAKAELEEKEALLARRQQAGGSVVDSVQNLVDDAKAAVTESLESVKTSLRGGLKTLQAEVRTSQAKARGDQRRAENKGIGARRLPTASSENRSEAL